MSETKRCPRCQAEIPAAAPEGLCPPCLLQAGLHSAAEPQTAAFTPQASSFVPPAPEALQAAFPQIEILELLGKGGMGAVYKARQPGLDRLVAVKILPPELSQDPAFVERFTREARALAKLSHPHIVPVYDFGQANGYCYFVMEYMDGVNLRQAMRAGTLTPAEALKIVPQICEALQFAHDEGIVHRDIKPENILLDKKGRVKIADFGLAKLLGKRPLDVSLTGAQQVMGSMHYMAPEQFQGSRDVDHRADIYSLGVTFYEMLTGELPIGRFAAPSHKVQIDVRLDEVVLRSLEKEPALRYQHASEIKTEVETINRTPSANREAAREHNPITLLDATGGWKRWWQLISLTAAVIVGFFIAMALSPSHVCMGISIWIGLMLLSILQSLMLTSRWSVDYRGHRIAFEFQNVTESRRLMIDGLTAASATGATPNPGGKVWDYELRATIPHGQGIGDEIVCTVERGGFLRCRILALPKTPITPAIDPSAPEQRSQQTSEIKTEVEVITGSDLRARTVQASVPMTTGGIPSTYYFKSLGMAALAWLLVPILWNAGAWGLGIVCVAIGACIVWWGRKTARFLPATAERWRQRSKMYNGYVTICAWLLASVGVYFMFLAGCRTWDRLHWNPFAKTSDQFKREYQGAEHRLLLGLQPGKDIPRAELRMTGWGSPVANDSILDFAAQILSITRLPNLDEIAPSLSVFLIGGWLFVAILAIYCTYLVLLSDLPVWSWDVPWRWSAVGLAVATLAPVLPYGIILFATPPKLDARFPGFARDLPENKDLSDIAAQLAGWAKKHGFEDGESSDWELKSIPEGDLLARIQVRHLRSPSIFDRWEMTYHGLQSKTPDFAVVLKSSPQAKRYNVSAVVRFWRRSDDLAEVNNVIESLFRAFDSTRLTFLDCKAVSSRFQ